MSLGRDICGNHSGPLGGGGCIVERGDEHAIDNVGDLVHGCVRDVTGIKGLHAFGSHDKVISLAEEDSLLLDASRELVRGCQLVLGVREEDQEAVVGLVEEINNDLPSWVRSYIR